MNILKNRSRSFGHGNINSIVEQMEGKIQFEVFCGPGQVAYGPYGVDLSAFRSVKPRIDRPGQRSLRSICKYLERAFGVDTERHILTIQALVSRSTEQVIWELMPIRNDSEWHSYVCATHERGLPHAILVQVYQKPQINFSNVQTEEVTATSNEAQMMRHVEEVIGHETQTEQPTETERATEPEGIADEGERFLNIVEQMDREDEEAEHMHEQAETDEVEEEQVPQEWDRPGFGDPVIHDGRREECFYRANEVIQGAKYPNKEAVKEAVKLWAISLRREFRVVKCNKDTYDVKYAQPNCPWRVHAHKGLWKTHWTVSIVVDHTCVLEGV